MIAIVDYGAGNLASVRKALELAATNACRPLGALAPDIRVTHDPTEVDAADAVVLPGVGAFGEGASALLERRLVEPLSRAFMDRRPFLGICLGLQLLFEESEESPGTPGLGLVAGTVRRFGEGLKVPHMGWNQIVLAKSHPAFAGVENLAYAYFVHSYYVAPSDEQVIAAETDYGVRFCSAIAFGSTV